MMILFLLILGFQTFGNVGIGAVTLMEKSIKFYTEEDYRELPITIENLRLVLDFYRVKNPEIVLRQAMLESGGFTSSLFKRSNNLFGMKVPRYRESVTKGFIMALEGKFAFYSYWTDSVKDYKLWQDTSPVDTDYYTYLKKRGYAEDPRYKEKLNRINI